MAPAPKVKVHVIPSFPSDISGENGVAVTKANGAVTVGLDVSDFQISAVAEDATATTYALALGDITDGNPKGSYSLVPFSGFQANSADLTSLSELGTFGIVVRIGDADYATRTITGTTNRLTVTNGNAVSAGPALDISTSYAGQSTITTLGTIITGVWNGTTIAIANGGTGQATATAAFDALSPNTTLGDLAYRGTSNNVRLAGNTTATKKFLRQTGTGSASAAPAWDTIVAADVPASALTKTDDTNVTLTLGGTPTTALLQATSITVGWTGQLSVARGGTGISSFGTGVATALGINVGSAGAFVTFNGAGGTPSSLVGTNISGTAASLTAGTASAVAVGGITGLATGVAAFLATPSSANLRTALTDESGTGALIFAGGALGAATATSINGNALTAGTWTLNGAAAATLTFNNTMTFGSSAGAIISFQGTDTYVGRTTTDTLTNKTLTSPIMTTPTLGVATATSINGNTFTSGTYTLTGAAGKTFTFNNSITLSGTDGVTLTAPTTNATLARTDAGQTFTGTQTFGALVATTINGNTFTAGTGILTIAAAKTLTVNNSITLSGTDATTMTFPTTSATLARTDAANTFTGAQTFSSSVTALNFATSASASISTAATMDTSAVAYTLAAGATIDILAATSGMLVLTDATYSGSTALVLIGGNAVVLVSQSTGTTWANSSSPGASNFGVFWNGGTSTCRIKNGGASNATFYAALTRTRPA